MTAPTLHLAWTVDDGPTPFTKKMIQAFKIKRDVTPKAEKGEQVTPKFVDVSIPATWFIQRNRLTEADIMTYLDLQNTEKHEIAIHGIHPDKDHLSWFQSNKQKSYSDLDAAIDYLKGFYALLTKKGLKVKFVRLPYGLITELTQLLGKRRVEKGTGSTAREIISGQRPTLKEELAYKPNPKSDPKIEVENEEIRKKNKKIREDNAAILGTNRDFQSLTSAIDQLGLHLWGGKRSGGISVQSWEAESAAEGTNRRQNDNVPRKQISMMKDVLPRNRKSKSASFVILCHDTTAGDVDEVKNDIREIEKVAKETGTTLVYHTMSSLFQHVTGQTP